MAYEGIAPVGIPANQRMMVLTGIDGKVAASLKMGTTAASSGRFFPLHIIVNVSAVSGVFVVGSFSMGTNSTAYDNIQTTTLLSGLTVLDNATRLAVSSGLTVPASTDIYFKNSGYTGVGSITLSAYIVGIYSQL